MARIILADESDVVIGHSERVNGYRELRHRISAAWIISPQGDILMARRALQKAGDPGKWGPAASGTLEENETYEENMLKELSEELGLRNVALTPGPLTITYGDAPRNCQWFIGRIEKTTPIQIDPKEVAEARWFKRDELISFFKQHREKFTANAPQYIMRMLEVTK